MKCSFCGNNNPDYAKFCGRCGKSLEQTDSSGTGSGTKNTPSPTGPEAAAPIGDKASGKKKKIIVAAISIAAAVIIAVVVCLLLFVFKNKNAGYERDTDLISADAGNTRLLDLTAYDLTARNSYEALDVIDSLSGALNISGSDELALTDESSFSGTSYYRFRQIYNDLTVIGRGIVLSANESGSVQLLTENLADMSQAETEAAIDYDEAMDAAIDYLDAQAAQTGDEDYESPTEATMRLCYYITYDEPVLSWSVSANASTVYVNANTAAVIALTEDTSCLTGYNSDGTIEVPAEQDDEGTYFIYDEERRITVYTWDGGNSRGSGSASVLSSDNLYFGDTEKEEDLEYETGIAWYQLICKVYDFFLDNYEEDGFGSTVLCYNDGYDFGGNALGGFYEYETDEYANYLSIGSGWNNVIDECGDVMAHEFTHAITKAIIGTDFADGAEAAALNEGLSDIMGILIDASITGAEPDWAIEFDYDSLGLDLLTYFNDRYAYDPEVSSYDDFKASDDAHDSGTLIFYCAYLMWEASGDSLEAINDINTLAELWYRTILLLQSDATFADCRAACEAAAAQMKDLGLLTDKQVNTVIYAFDTCKIQYAADTNLTTDKSLIVTVYDGDKNETDNYHCVITNRDGDITDEFNGSDIGAAFQIDFNEEGLYKITVSYDTYNYPSVTAIVTVGAQSRFKLASLTDAKLDIYTTFGTNITGTVTDENGQTLDNVNVTAEGSSGYSYSTSSNGGSYILYLPVGSYEVTYELDGYDSMTAQQDVATGTNQAETILKTEAADASELELYAEILDLFYYGISTQWENYDDFDDEGDKYYDAVSYLWWFYADFDNLSLSDAGFAFIDLDGNGTSELLIDVYEEDGEHGSTIRDLYTYQNGEVVHLAYSAERWQYWLCSDYEIGERGSGSASTGGYYYYEVSSDSDELVLLENLDYEYIEGKDPIWYYSDNGKDAYEDSVIISDDEAWAIIDGHETLAYDLTPFSDYTPSGESAEDAQAAAGVLSEEEFAAAVDGQNVLYYITADYDGDGLQEAYGITGDYGDFSNNVYIYFVSSEGTVTCVMSDTYGYLSTIDELIDADGDLYLVWDVCAGSSAVSHIFGVRGGEYYEPEISGEYESFQSYKDGFIGLSADWNEGWHDYDVNFFEYDAASGQFIYLGTEDYDYENNYVD